MRHFSDRMYFAGYVQVYIPRSALMLLGTNKAWRHILPESSTHRQVVITQLAYERDDPPFIIGIIPFLFLFIYLPAFYLLSICCSCHCSALVLGFNCYTFLSTARHPSTTSWNIHLSSEPDPSRELHFIDRAILSSAYTRIALPLATFLMIWTLCLA